MRIHSAYLLVPIFFVAFHLVSGQRIQEPQVAASVVNEIPQRAISVMRGPIRHYFIDGEVDGVKLRFLIDTGASSLFLTKEAGKKLGLNQTQPLPTTKSEGAGGPIEVSYFNAKVVKVGTIEMNGIEVVISKSSDSKYNLLGMNFIEKLSRFEITDDSLLMEKVVKK